MTTLVAIQGNGWAAVGCDSRSSGDDGRLMQLATHKIIENNGVLIAGSGASRGSNILQFGWKAPKPRATDDLDTFMTQTFIPSMRKVFIDSGYDMKEDGDAAAHDSQFLVVVRGVIYPIFEDYSWDRDVRGIYCSGSGADIALGAIEAFASSRKQTTPKVAELDIRMAINIASRWDIHTAEPVIVKVQHAK